MRDKKLIDIIQQDLLHIAITVHVYLYTDEQLVRERLKTDGFDDNTINRRIRRNSEAWQDYLETPDDEIVAIVNNSSRKDFQRKIALLVEKYSNAREKKNILYLAPDAKITLPDSLIGHKEKMVRALEKYPYSNNIFLMMKFRDSNYEYYKIIEDVLKAKGFNCVRADDAEWNLTDETHNYMAVAFCCKYGIALFDEPEIFEKNGTKYRVDYNPNVAYELGLMQGHNKKCLILRHDSLTDMPFDLVKDLFVSFKGLDLIRKLKTWISTITTD